MTNISRVYYKIEHFDFGNSGCKYFPKKDVQTAQTTIFDLGA